LDFKAEFFLFSLDYFGEWNVVPVVADFLLEGISYPTGFMAYACVLIHW
jgi:hypothetical protein